MAHLRRRARLGLGCALAALAPLVVSCHGASEMGTVELELFAIPVDCSEGACVDPSDGSAVEPTWMRRWAFVSTQTTQYEPEGRYLHFQVVGPDGALGQVEIDVPEDPALGEPSVTYVERVGEETTFEADAADGWIQLAADALGEECPCEDGRFELVFRSPGEDGEAGTEDDAVRHLSRARVTLGDEFCVDPVRRDFEQGRLDVEIIDRCPTFTPRPGPAPSSTPPSSYPDTGGGGCESEPTPTSSGSSGGCEGDGSGSSGGGCEGDSSCSGGGCEGDSSSSGSGCEGDSSSSGSGCEGDAGGGSGCEGDASSASLDGARRPRCRTRPRALLAGPIQTPLLVALVLGFQRLRRRRR